MASDKGWLAGTVFCKPEDTASITLYAPDGVEQWQRAMHARCGPHPTLEVPITCPWCNPVRQ